MTLRASCYACVLIPACVVTAPLPSPQEYFVEDLGELLLWVGHVR